MNPTEPTTPQPKPAAGLLPCPFCGKEAEACPGDSTYITCAGGCIFSLPRSQWNTRPLPTPHVEAGVRELAVAQEIADWAQENKELFFRHPAHVAHIAAILARHHTAAETVGECPDCRGTGIETCLITGGRAPCHCQPVDSFAVRAVQALLKERGINTAKPAPPATQSALEAAREALEFARDEIGYAGNKRICDALAALAAVLPPAKGGDGV